MEKRSTDDQNERVSRRSRRPQPPQGVGRGMNKEISGELICSSDHHHHHHQRNILGASASALSTAARPPPPTRTLSTELMKLAAVAVDLNVRIRSANMPVAMQEKAFRYTRSLLLLGDGDDHNCIKLTAPKSKSPNPSQIALAIKKEFDASYGVAWHCIVGKSFGSFVTHSPGGFLYFSVDNLSFLLFKTEVRPVLLRRTTTTL
ncbi:Dynein light chain [Macleaya cordata]|uniref:Dynein light chain n=1 Tax=Macleaya cordata TaxID=56857 RepID=A0A200QUY0_MACCD|nr:Dynein light chain [Macleaya cordata]